MFATLILHKTESAHLKYNLKLNYTTGFNLECLLEFAVLAFYSFNPLAWYCCSLWQRVMRHSGLPDRGKKGCLTFNFAQFWLRIWFFTIIIQNENIFRNNFTPGSIKYLFCCFQQYEMTMPWFMDFFFQKCKYLYILHLQLKWISSCGLYQYLDVRRDT